MIILQQTSKIRLSVCVEFLFQIFSTWKPSILKQQHVQEEFQSRSLLKDVFFKGISHVPAFSFASAGSVTPRPPSPPERTSWLRPFTWKVCTHRAWVSFAPQEVVNRGLTADADPLRSFCSQPVLQFVHQVSPAPHQRTVT